jgi:carbon monoxide dehydrogenase subunit G
MRLRESHTLPVPLDEAWSALNDVALLQRALPGCESLIEIARDEFVGEMAIPLGLATSRFTVYVHRREIDAPQGCTLHFETRTTGSNGVGSAALRLWPDSESGTTLQADIAVSIDGVMGVLGAPLIELAAHEMARQFFEGLRALASARSRIPRAGAPMP